MILELVFLAGLFDSETRPLSNFTSSKLSLAFWLPDSSPRPAGA
jgi:hypothetical protein